MCNSACTRATSQGSNNMPLELQVRSDLDRPYTRQCRIARQGDPPSYETDNGPIKDGFKITLFTMVHLILKNKMRDLLSTWRQEMFDCEPKYLLLKVLQIIRRIFLPKDGRQSPYFCDIHCQVQIQAKTRSKLPKFSNRLWFAET